MFVNKQGAHMNLQENIITRYKKTFPKDTLKKTSNRTNLHLTRIFRIFNGFEMRISEYEAFETAIHNYNQSTTNPIHFINMANHCVDHLSESTLSKISDQMLYFIKMSAVIQTNKNESLNQYQLA